jgi:hypothetical protein
LLQIGIGELPEMGFQRIDAVHQGGQALQFPLVFAAEYLFKNQFDHMSDKNPIKLGFTGEIVSL